MDLYQKQGGNGGRRRLNQRPYVDPLKDAKMAVERAYAHALGSGLTREAAIFKHAAEELIERENPLFFKAIGQMKHVPVTIEEFIHGQDFLAGAEFELWPALERDLIETCPDVWTGQEPITEFMSGGATGTGKTFGATGNILFHVYQMCCFNQPQRLFGLQPNTALVCMLQSVSPTITKRVIYEPLRQIFEAMPFNKRWVQWNDQKDSSLELMNHVQIVPSAASLQALVGQAIFAALLDEVNFMAIVENSKTIPGPNGLGGKFDQAEQTYYNISRRRKRSFITKGPSIGCLCVSSSTRYKGDFLDRRIDEVQKYEEAGIVVRRHKQYDVNPKFAPGQFGTFKLLVGTDEYGTRVLTDDDAEGQTYPQGAEVLDVPEPYRVEFLKDPEAALRDVIGIATNAITPFIRRRQKITDAWARGVARGILPMTDKSTVELATDGLPAWIEGNMPQMVVRKRPHFIHVDGSKNNDPTGVSIVRFDGVTRQPSKDGQSMETLPKFTVVAALQIKPNAVAEIDMAEIRGWLLQLQTLFGYNIVAISMDGYNSNESLLMLRKAGIGADLVSVDRSTGPYEDFRDILYQDRVDFVPDCEVLRTELSQVEYYPKDKKVDHPPRGTKDVADAVVAAIANALEHRAVWSSVDVYSTDVQPVAGTTGPVMPEPVRRNVERPTGNRPHAPRRPD